MEIDGTGFRQSYRFSFIYTRIVAERQKKKSGAKIHFFLYVNPLRQLGQYVTGLDETLIQTYTINGHLYRVT